MKRRIASVILALGITVSASAQCVTPSTMQIVCPTAGCDNGNDTVTPDPAGYALMFFWATLVVLCQY